MTKVLLPMKDGGIVDYKDDHEYIPGCETCDYGSEYINEITVVLTKYKISVVINNMYNYALSESDIMRTILPAYDKICEMTEAQFVTWLHDQLVKMMKDNDKFCDVEEVLKKYDVQ